MSDLTNPFLALLGMDQSFAYMHTGCQEQQPWVNVLSVIIFAYFPLLSAGIELMDVSHLITRPIRDGSALFMHSVSYKATP